MFHLTVPLYDSDIVTTIGKGNGSFLILLDLSAAFDTIDHSNLFAILEKYVAITGDALQFIKSYFFDRSWCTRIESIMSNIVNIIRGVPQDFVLGPFKFCVQHLPLEAILRYHGIGYHKYADDTHFYHSFKCDNPSLTLSKLTNCYFAAPTEWNRLDKRIRRIFNLNTFRSEKKTILFLNYFDV